ncbi:hypothetical protein CDD82_3110 [Ophiocordyceps australis]|uniref:C2 NT-type domain-containing protein n=1 Tax=Ophiocordyceps australis TaxID=1399860 RepID=A0A2C5Z8V8_9HYPO|nr:hypothetical protein CDD82_3110 [Ophiocordyceps australis]
MSSLIGKHRKAKFELHLKIYDLNNVPLVSGTSFIKWHIDSSIHAEHRGRTAKCPIANHCVDYGFGKIVPSVRISIDKNNMLAECPIVFEVVQEFALSEKITLGFVRFNLGEYVEESQAVVKDMQLSSRKSKASIDTPASTSPPPAPSSSMPSSSGPSDPLRDGTVQDGVMRRHLMQDSKVNSTLKIGILMLQVDGDRNFIAPALKSAPVFGGITGLMGPEQAEDDIGPLPTVSKNRETTEVQDLYRHALAASWLRQPAEPAVDECIEDIFANGNGWNRPQPHDGDSASSDASDTGDQDVFDASYSSHGHGHDTLRPRDLRRRAFHFGGHTNSHSRSRSRSQSRTRTHGPHHHHRRPLSASGDAPFSPSPGRAPRHGPPAFAPLTPPSHTSQGAHDDDAASLRSEGTGSIAPALGSASSSSSDGDRRRGIMARQRPPHCDVREDEVRDDLVAWKVPSVST